ncbi:MAG: helix-turn-helix transcriptional regulator [Ilumatobacter sp.]|nr:helix-turn-helix transcriptional regulator [Ilumatobacter sp.]
MGSSNVGVLVKQWRHQRSRSQLDLALSVGVSTRHLSFVETGKSRPSPELIEAIGIHLDVPLRDRNSMLLAAGFAPRYRQTSLDDPAMADVVASLRRLLDTHAPYPALVLDRHWNVVLSNRGAAAMMVGLPERLLTPRPNVFRVSLHPEGLAAITANFDEWATYLLRQLDRTIAIAPDDELLALRDEVHAYPNVAELRATSGWAQPVTGDQILIPCELSIGDARLSMFTTLTSFGTPRDITLDELAVEHFFPADAATTEFFESMPPQ